MPAAFYGADLASVHDAGFLAFAREAAPAVLKRLARRCEPGTRVIEIGCGSGGLTRELVGAGYRVCGVDVSPAMVRLARGQTPGARLRVVSWQRFVPPPCAAIVAVGECFNYLATSPDRHVRDLDAFFRRAGEALQPGGILLFDLLETCPGAVRLRTHDSQGSGWAIRAETRESGRQITRQIMVTREVAGRTRVSVEIHRQYRLSRRQVESALRAAGFVVTWRDGFGRHRLRLGHVVAEALRVFG